MSAVARDERPASRITETIPVEMGDDAEQSYPEGGLEAWLVVLGAWSAMIPSMGLLNTLAVLQAWVSDNELPNMSESQIGWIFSCYAFFLYICGAQVGGCSGLESPRISLTCIDKTKAPSSTRTTSDFSSFLVLSGLWHP